METSPVLYTWPASYYNSALKRWKYGELSIYPTCCRFQERLSNTIFGAVTNTQPCSLIITLDSISELKKSASRLWFKCLVVMVNETQHWFSSLPSRDVAYNVLLHFWKERLLQPDSGRGKVTQKATRLGRELLEIASDSNTTLEKAGRTLLQQGEQLEHAMGVMCDLHADLDVAERLTDNLDSWFGQWGCARGSYNSQEALLLVDARGLPIIHEFPVLYYKGVHERRQTSNTANRNKELTGSLRISREGITVLDDEQKHVCHYKPRDISAITVVSPWKVNVAQYQLGQPDTAFAIASTRMANILEILHPVYGSKMDLRSPDNLTFPIGANAGESNMDLRGPESSSGPVAVSTRMVRSEHLCGAAALSSGLCTEPNVSCSGGDVAQEQVSMQQQSEISEQEAEELSSLIGRMKSMALDIHTEQERQLETLDKLTETVDDANIRLQVDTKRLNKLM